MLFVWSCCSSLHPLSANLVPCLQGSKVLIMSGAGASIGNQPIVTNFYYDFQPRERLGLVGPNGAGKTTLMKLLANQLPLSTGTRELGETTAVGYLSQQPAPIRDDISALQYIRCDVLSDLWFSS